MEVLQAGMYFLFLSPVVMQEALVAEEIFFNRKLTGVELDPTYVRATHEDDYSGDCLTTQNIRTMLEVIATKFSRVITPSVYPPGVPNNITAYMHLRHHTYYQEKYVKARTAEMAAHINRDRNDLSLIVIIEINTAFGSLISNTGNYLSLEAAQVANSIFPGTVEGFVLSDLYTLNGLSPAKRLLSYVKDLRTKSLNRHLRIGLKQNCDRSWRRSILRTDSAELLTLKKEILLNLDFIVCSTSAYETLSMNRAAKPVFDAIKREILADRDGIKSLDNTIEVMWNTRWKRPNITGLYNSTQYTNNFRDYWVYAGRFATKHNYPLWFQNAFEERDSFGRWESTAGWWKLTRRELINNVTGYELVVPGFLGSSDVPRNSEIIIVVGVLLLSVVMLPALACVINRKYRSSLKGFCILTKQEIDEFYHGVGITESDQPGDQSFANIKALKQPYDRSLEIPREKIEILSSQILGGGEHGCVVKALATDKTGSLKEVALKMTKPNSGTTALKGFLSEIKILSYLQHHPNIVPIIAAYTAEMTRGIVYVATELCPLGSLKTCLKKCQNDAHSIDLSLVPFNDMNRWAYEIACGMEYLATKGVIHGDLATRNVLLSSESVAKITDFGLSRRLYEYTKYIKTSQEPLPWRWMAFESLKAMEFSTKSDVWSYGVTLWEIFTLGAQPYPGLTWTVDFVEMLENGLRLMKPRYATSEIFEIMKNCWMLNKDARPTFTELKNLLRHVQTVATDDNTTLAKFPEYANLGNISTITHTYPYTTVV